MKYIFIFVQRYRLHPLIAIILGFPKRVVGTRVEKLRQKKKKQWQWQEVHASRAHDEARHAKLRDQREVSLRKLQHYKRYINSGTPSQHLH